MKRTAVDSKSGNVKRRAGQRRPKIYKKIHRSGQVGYVVDLGLINGKRERRAFQSKVEAETFGEMARVKKQNEGTAAFGISESVRVDASKASAMLAPHGSAWLRQLDTISTMCLRTGTPHRFPKS